LLPNSKYQRGSIRYGYIDSTGSPNAIVLHPELSLTISPTVSMVATHFSFWRTSTGSLQDLAIRWRADRHTIFEALATYYEAGAFLREGFPPGKNLSYVALKMNYRF
jgi:hypothetical protein